MLQDEKVRQGLLGVFTEAIGGDQVIECLVKHYEEGWSYRSLADLVGEKESTIRNRMNRALALMKRHELAPLRWLEPPPESQRPGRSPIDPQSIAASVEENAGLDDELSGGLGEVPGPSGGVFEGGPEGLAEFECGDAHPSPHHRARYLAHSGQYYRGGLLSRLWHMLTYKEPAPMEITDITIILDRSGSMEALRAEVISGFNAYLDSLAGVEALCNVSLVQFNHKRETTWEAVSPELAERLSDDNYRTEGFTSLYDALCDTVDDISSRLSNLDEPNCSRRILVAILTDGLDTSSCREAASLPATIESKQRREGWEFLFLAAGPDAIAEAARVGICDADSYQYDASPEGIEEAMMTLSLSTSQLMRSELESR